MKKLLIAAAVAVAATGTAGAADLPVKAPPMPPAPVASWTGCYISGGVGYGMWRQHHFDESDPGFVQFTQATDTGGDGWLGRVGGGCDYQVAPQFVIGAFADYDWMSLKGNFLIPTNGLVGQEKETSSWAVGGRLGYLPYQNLLTFVSGGYTQARFDQVNFFGGFPAIATPFSMPATTYSGGFIGGGYEYRLPWFQGLTWKTEYRYNFYNSKDIPYLPLSLTGTATHSDKNVQTVTTSLVWRFNFGSLFGARY